MRRRTLVVLALLTAAAAVTVALWRGSGPLPDPEGCSAVVGGHAVFITTEQAENAALIAGIGVRRGLPARAVSIALATAFQESKLRNLTYGDRDSLGLFQQRPSQGWGSIEQVRDPIYASNAFYDALAKVPDYQKMRITEAAQTVQRSGYPEAYEQHAADARALASALTGYSAGGRFSCVSQLEEGNARADEVDRLADSVYGSLAGLRATRSGEEMVTEFSSSEAGRRAGWSVAQFLVAHAKTLELSSVEYAGRVWQTGRGSEAGWTGTDTRGAVIRVGLR